MVDRKRVRTIIWDFNGTLLNDMQVCVDCMNIMLGERGLAKLDLERYRQIFTFPVREYYEKLGFDFNREPFEIPAHQFIDHYRVHLTEAPLHAGVIDLLDQLKKRRIRHVILSAMEQALLEDTLEKKGILGHFDKVVGIRDHLADGKLEMARELVASLGEDLSGLYLVGDTTHDYEVAAGANIPCLLIAHGHQSPERLRPLSCQVVNDLEELMEKLLQ
jgi:phosphoglycolate phosphatase